MMLAYIILYDFSFTNMQLSYVCKHTSGYVYFWIKFPSLAPFETLPTVPLWMPGPECGNMCLLLLFLHISKCYVFTSSFTETSSRPHSLFQPWQLVHSQLCMTGRTTGSLSPLSHCRLRKRTGLSGSKR